MKISICRPMGVSLACAICLLACEAVADSPPDPYADAVDTNTLNVTSATNALGAPDGALATFLGFIDNRLVLDMGKDEEGLDDITIYYGGLSLQINTSLDFLSSNYTILASAPLGLTHTGAGSFSTNVVYPTNAPYRYVRIYGGLFQVMGIDAIQAANYYVPPVITNIQPTETGFTISWMTYSTAVYDVSYTTDDQLTNSNWQLLASGLSSPAFSLSAVDTNPVDVHRLYRVVLTTGP